MKFKIFKLVKKYLSSFISQLSSANGFTFIELVVVMGIALILFGFITFNFLGAQKRTSTISQTDSLISDLKSQQIKSMLGFTQGGENLETYGIYFEQNRYVLFKGSSYSPSDPSNFVINIGSDLEFSNIVFPGSIVVFSKGSGEVLGFVEGSNSIALKNKDNTLQKTVRINRYGVVEEVN